MLSRTSRTPRSPVRLIVARQARAVGYLIKNLFAGMVGLAVLMILLIVLFLSVVGVGLLLLGPVDLLVRHWCEPERRRVGRFLGRRIDTSDEARRPGSFGVATARVASGALGRDAALLVLRVLVGIPLGVVAILLPLFALNHLLLPLYWWALPEGENGGVFTVTSWLGAVGVGVVGAGAFAVWVGALVVAPLDARLAAALLATSPEQVQRRRADVEQVRRQSAMSAHSAELQRIERDLHDAAQNRLVAVAMYVGLARRQLETGSEDPEPALDKAGQAATDAIAEVRRVVQGIYPPILTEEGLVPAVGFLVDQSQIPTRLVVEQAAASPAAVDAAIYFSVAELLTNIAKHSGATEASVELAWHQVEQERWVRVIVNDDGRGGIDQDQGSGIVGVIHRVNALGGSVQTMSPPGGPTRIEVNLPCAS